MMDITEQIMGKQWREVFETSKQYVPAHAHHTQSGGDGDSLWPMEQKTPGEKQENWRLEGVPAQGVISHPG